MAIGLSGMAASYALAGIGTELKSSTMTALSLIASIGFYQNSIGPLSWIYSTELFPTHIRTFGSSFVFLLDNVGNTLTLFLQPYLSDVIGTSGTLLFYSLNCIGSFFLVDWLLPETQNLSLEEVQIKLARR